jgi:hypothetical protein
MAMPCSAMAAKTAMLIPKNAWVTITEDESPARPGHGHHRLDGVFGFLATFRGFVAHAPFADLLKR